MREKHKLYLLFMLLRLKELISMCSSKLCKSIYILHPTKETALLMSRTGQKSRPRFRFYSIKHFTVHTSECVAQIRASNTYTCLHPLVMFLQLRREKIRTYTSNRLRETWASPPSAFFFLQSLKYKSNVLLDFSPGLVHRLQKEISGTLWLARCSSFFISNSQLGLSPIYFLSE